MSPKPREAVDSWKVPDISHKYPTYRTATLVSNEGWLQGKRQDDAAEGLWRIGDILYDLNEFTTHHPGGAFWIEQTKGTDITEAFVSHHISPRPAQLLGKYEVRQAAQPRNYKFTFHEHGFYMTLKRRIHDKLQAMDYKPSRKTDLLHFGLLASLLLFSAAAAYTDRTVFKLLAGLAMCWLGTASHNYFHQRDNWRMYAFNFTLMNCNSWRVSHALSHHIYPNSLHDLEMSLFEPFLCWVPSRHYANQVQRFVSVIISPFVYASMCYVQFLGRLAYSVARRNIMYWHDLICFSLPILMYLVSGEAYAHVLMQWLSIVTLSSLLFGIIGLTAAHHHPCIYHAGDALRNDLDWGLFQLDSIVDRSDVKGSDLLVLTHFGEHALHHLFPTLDHSVLKSLYPEFLQTLQEFNAESREMSHLSHIIGQNRQLLRTTPNPIAPDAKKFK